MKNCKYLITLLKRLFVIAILLTPFLLYSQNLKIFQIDVDQGGSTLFVTPNGSTLLVDAGKNGHGRRIKKILEQEGITHINHFVNTHYHEDHYGGIDDLARDPQITIGISYDRGDKAFLPASKLNEATYKDYDATVGSTAIMLTRGMQIPIDSAITITCISHGGVVLGEINQSTGVHENDMSISLLIKYGNFRYFVGGDIESSTENKIAEKDLVLDVDIYQANHHGSHTSSSLAFMQDLVPAVIVISNGSNESYYHPRLVTLNTYSQLTPPPAVFQTNKYLGSKPQAGNVNDDFIADLDTQGDEGTISLLVDLNQNAYSLKYRNQIKNFTIKSRGEAAIQPSAVVIERMMVDPIGSDIANEFIVIKNKTSDSFSLAGWVLLDASSRVWILDASGEMLPGQSLKIMRRGMPMSLNNDGDVITLLNPSNVLIDKFQYAGSAEGIEIITGH